MHGEDDDSKRAISRDGSHRAGNVLKRGSAWKKWKVIIIRKKVSQKKEET